MFFDRMNDLDATDRAWHLAYRYCLRRRRFPCAIFGIFFILSLIAIIFATALLITTPLDSPVKRWLVGAGYCFGIPIALLTIFSLRQLDLEARWFASEAVDDGNYSEQDIASYYKNTHLS